MRIPTFPKSTRRIEHVTGYGYRTITIKARYAPCWSNRQGLGADVAPHEYWRIYFLHPDDCKTVPAIAGWAVIHEPSGSVAIRSLPDLAKAKRVLRAILATFPRDILSIGDRDKVSSAMAAHIKQTAGIPITAWLHEQAGTNKVATSPRGQ